MTVQPISAHTPAPSRALVLFSGGQDSSVCLLWALEQFEHVETVAFDYGQRHDVELQARLHVRAGVQALNPQWAARLGDDHVVDLRGYGALCDTALTQERVIDYDQRGLPTTFVPARNLVFLTVASAIADRRGQGVLVGGMCETDFSGYPDCRRATLDALESAIALGLDRPLRIATPLMHLSKADSWQLAHDLGGDAAVELIREHSHSCYLGVRDQLHDWGYGCGDCPACQLRAHGWAAWRES